MPALSVAIIGASGDRSRYANKAVRAYRAHGHTVYPVHPRETQVEGLPAYPSVLRIPGPVDRAVLYVRPAVGAQVLAEVAQKGVKELWVSPGAESPELLERARALGLDPVVACSILAMGEDPEAG
ncbi:MAG: CoA-binding protein [Armatimonadetes bacterium]|nr:CoA-binding protein [Armatimonadota bacterium]